MKELWPLEENKYIFFIKWVNSACLYKGGNITRGGKTHQGAGGSKNSADSLKEQGLMWGGISVLATFPAEMAQVHAYYSLP